MKKYWYWIELIGFDVNDIEGSVDTFLDRTGGAEGVSLLLFSVDFVNSFANDGEDKLLSPAVCSYAAHGSNGERYRQQWTKKLLKKLIATLKDRGIKVLLCVFNMYLYHIDGKEICEGFSDEHQEINEVCNDGSVFQVVSMIKNFRDGSSYGDYFISKLIEVLDYYGFDGVQIADGISSARLPVERSDYSDDLVSRFVKQGGVLPDGVELSVGTDRKKISERAGRIFNEKRAEWTEFVSDCWSKFVRNLTHELKNHGKYTLVNTAWTREPAEAYIRYGMNYAESFDGNVDALMVEENSQTMAEGGVMHYAGAKATLKRRARLAYEGYVMQLALKAFFPDLPQITMCPIRDNEEQFDTLRCAYTEIMKSSALRNMAVCFDGEEYIPVSQNLLYTLSDAVSRSEWSDLHNLEQSFNFKNPSCENGLIAVFNKNCVKKEAERYFKKKTLTSYESYVRCIVGGLPISGSCSVQVLEKCSRPVIVANAELYDVCEKEILENYSYPMFVVGYGKALKKQPDVVFTVNGESTFGICGYNLDVKKQKNYKISYPEPDLNKKDKDFGSFTSELDYEKIPIRFFRKIADELIKILCLPKLYKGTGCKCFPTKSDGKDICVITNDSYFYELPIINVWKPISSARALTKIPDYRVDISENEFRVLINNRGAEAVELTYKEETKK